MNIEIFNKNYWVRRHGEPYEYRGYWVYPVDDYVASIHVHPLGAMSTLALPEGEASFQRLEGHASDKLNVAGELGDDTRGDLLLYDGHWYECISTVKWNDTGLLSHYNYEFTLASKNGAGDTSLNNPPTENPDDYAEEKRLPAT